MPLFQQYDSSFRILLVLIIERSFEDKLLIVYSHSLPQKGEYHAGNEKHGKMNQPNYSHILRLHQLFSNPYLSNQVLPALIFFSEYILISLYLIKKKTSA